MQGVVFLRRLFLFCGKNGDVLWMSSFELLPSRSEQQGCYCSPKESEADAEGKTENFSSATPAPSKERRFGRQKKILYEIIDKAAPTKGKINRIIYKSRLMG